MDREAGGEKLGVATPSWRRRTDALGGGDSSAGVRGGHGCLSHESTSPGSSAGMSCVMRRGDAMRCEHGTPPGRAVDQARDAGIVLMFACWVPLACMHVHQRTEALVDAVFFF